MKDKATGFTLFEIIIVLAIIGAILGIGIYTMSQMYKSTQLSEAAGDVLSILKETQNMAKNNTIPKVVPSGVDKANSVFYFVLEFTNSASAPYGNINRYTYARKNGVWSPTTALDTKSNLKSRLINSGVNYSKTSGECKFVMFEALSGDMKVYASTSTIVPIDLIYNSTLNECKISVSLANETTVKYLYINAGKGNFGIEGETN